MTLTDIPYAHYTRITEEKGHLSLHFHPDLLNHIGTLHAGALFTLAETASGFYLASLFPDEDTTNLIPLLRNSEVKYKHPATGTIYATASINEEKLVHFRSQIERRGRATITVSITLLDENEVSCMIGDFGWYVQKKT